jgi:hypothetical protein
MREKRREEGEQILPRRHPAKSIDLRGSLSLFCFLLAVSHLNWLHFLHCI